MNSNKMIIAVATFLSSIFVAFIACVVWLVPVAGIIIYPFICGTAMILSLVSCYLAKESKPLRIAGIIFAVFLLLSILFDMGVIISIMLEMFQ